MSFKEHQIADIRLRTADLETMDRQVTAWLEQPQRTLKTVSYINPHVFTQAHKYSDVAEFVSYSDLVCIDGVGMQLGLKIFHGVSAPRVVATHLFEHLLARVPNHVSAVLIGASSDEVKVARKLMNYASSGIEIIACCSGFQSDSQYQEFFLKHSSIDLVLIGAGSPRSEQIAQIARRYCQRALIQHIGAGTIKIYAGTKRRAPLWMSRLGVEWLHRILFEPHTRTRYGNGAVQFIRLLISTALDKP